MVVDGISSQVQFHIPASARLHCRAKCKRMSPVATPVWAESNRALLEGEFARLRAQLGAQLEGAPIARAVPAWEFEDAPAIDQLSAIFGLSVL